MQMPVYKPTNGKGSWAVTKIYSCAATFLVCCRWWVIPATRAVVSSRAGPLSQYAKLLC